MQKKIAFKFGIVLICALSFLMFIFLVLLVARPRWFFSQIFPQQSINIKTITNNYDPKATIAIFNNRSIIIPKSTANFDKKVLGINDASNVLKLIFVDLTNQRLTAYEGGKQKFDFAISSGKWNLTPTGKFKIWIKLRYTRMTGGSKSNGTYYNLPNVPYTMYFYNENIPKESGYGLHGVYWHNNFGQPMSHGCINLSEENAAQLYYWTNPAPEADGETRANGDNGTEVIIYGQAP